MSVVWEKIILILLVLVSILVGMTLHELGHFLFAKLFKVNVKEFSIGIGPKIFSFRTRNGMLVSIKPFLLMAYVLIDSNKLIKVYTEIYNDSLELGYKNHYFGGYESEENSFKYKFRRFCFLKSHDKYERLSKREESKLLIDDCKSSETFDILRIPPPAIPVFVSSLKYKITFKANTKTRPMGSSHRAHSH